jgi:hypothetical protein
MGVGFACYSLTSPSRLVSSIEGLPSSCSLEIPIPPAQGTFCELLVRASTPNPKDPTKPKKFWVPCDVINLANEAKLSFESFECSVGGLVETLPDGFITVPIGHPNPQDDDVFCLNIIGSRVSLPRRNKHGVWASKTENFDTVQITWMPRSIRDMIEDGKIMLRVPKRLLQGTLDRGPSAAVEATPAGSPPSTSSAPEAPTMPGAPRQHPKLAAKRKDAQGAEPHKLAAKRKRKDAQGAEPHKLATKRKREDKDEQHETPPSKKAKPNVLDLATTRASLTARVHLAESKVAPAKKKVKVTETLVDRAKAKVNTAKELAKAAHVNVKDAFREARQAKERTGRAADNLTVARRAFAMAMCREEALVEKHRKAVAAYREAKAELATAEHAGTLAVEERDEAKCDNDRVTQELATATAALEEMEKCAQTLAQLMTGTGPE